MNYYRCKCGNSESWSSYGPNPCKRCTKCNSGLAASPSEHVEPIEHDFSSVEKICTDQDEMTITRCAYCHRTKAEIEKGKTDASAQG